MPHVETLFCDDIREEASGKLSLIGCYSEFMYVRFFPITLPKLCVFMKFVPGLQPLEQLELAVLKDDEPLQNLVLTRDQLIQSAGIVHESDQPNEVRMIRAVQCSFTFSPLQLDGPCTLTVRVTSGDTDINSLPLTVEQVTEKTSR